MTNLSKILFFCSCCITFISCDRITKNLAKTHLKDQPAVLYFNDTIRLQYAENTGAALSMGENLPKSVSFWLLSIMPLIVLMGVLYYTIKHIQPMRIMKLFSISLIFSGGIGNIIDRLLYDRHVTDFINLGIGNLRTGIFNVADICVTAGVIGILFFFRESKNKPPSNTADIPAL